MWLTRIAINRPLFIWMVVLALIVMGLRAMRGMRAELNPRIDIPYITITVVYPGASPSEMETLVTKPIEDAVASVNGVKNVTSYSQESLSNIVIEFLLEVNIDTAASDVRERVDAARNLLPTDVQPPVIRKLDISAFPVLMIGMTGQRPPRDVRHLADEVVKYRLGQVSGVGSVAVSGGDIREIRVAVNRERLSAYGLSINDVVSSLGRQNLNLPGGRITQGPRDYTVRTIGEFQSVAEIADAKLPVMRQSQVAMPARFSLRVGDVAEVLDTIADPEQIARVDGRNSVGLVVTKLSTANTVDVVDGVKEALRELKDQLPADIEFVISQDQSKQVRAATEDITVSLVLGSLLASLVVFLFLHNLRGTLIVALAIPTSLIATLIPIYFAGFTLNQMTMLGLSLVVGILVDDSIVVLENIYRHLARGEMPREAAFNGRAEIGLAAVTITLVDVVVFVPIAFMGGIVGRFFREFGITVAFATLFSLFVSFTLTPMLASRWYRPGEILEAERGVFAWLDRFYGGLDREYRGLLAASLRRRFVPVLAGLLGMIIVMAVAGRRLQFQFVPVMDQGTVIVTAELPVGTALQVTDQVMYPLEEKVREEVPETDHIFTSVGTTSGGAITAIGRGRQYGQLSISLVDKKSALDTVLGPLLPHRRLRTRSDKQVAQDLRRALRQTPGFAGARLTVSTLAGMGGGLAPVTLELLGQDLRELEHVATAMRDRMAEVAGIIDPDISVRPGRPEVQVRPDRVKAARLGINVVEVALALRNSIAGNTDAKYREGGYEYDIRVQFADSDRASPADVEHVIVASPTGEPIRASALTRVDYGAGPTEINRKNRQREVVVSANLEPGYATGNVWKEIDRRISDIPLRGVRVQVGGEEEMRRREMGYLSSALLLSLALVYMLMASLFNSLLHPFTIMLAQPMALIGGLGALVLTGETMSIIAMIGIIMLVGLVGKNAILLIDYTNTLRARGIERNRAIEEAGPTRLRPILMTTVAMILGMLPIALRLGRASEMRAPLAIVVIGGLILSTLLTLIMIPVIYSLFDDVTAWVRRGRLRRR